MSGSDNGTACQQKKITSVSDILQEVMDVEDNPFAAGMGESLFLYRGHANVDWELQPSVLRKSHAESISLPELFQSSQWCTVLNNERTINRKFQAESYPYLGEIPAVQVYFAAQHHGLPTRLLDWSLNPLVALFFACTDNFESNGCVYRLRPRDLPNIFMGRALSLVVDSPPSPFDDIVYGFHSLIKDFIQDSLFDFKSSCELQNTPIIPIAPTASTPRIIAQSSRFTFHPPIFDSVDSKKINVPAVFDESQSYFEKFVIENSNKKNILAELNRLGVHRYSLFPDLDNLARHLKTIYCSCH